MVSAMRLAVFLFLLAQLVYPIQAEENKWQVTTASEELSPLTDDLVRADLFKLVIAAAEKENPTPGVERRSLCRKTPFIFPQNALEDEGKPRGNSIFGIDISHRTGWGISFDSLKDQNVRRELAAGRHFLDHE